MPQRSPPRGEPAASLDPLCRPELDPLFWQPERRGVDSAWWGHVPFAHWIISASRPGIFVELGTHRGVSYAAFCHAVARLGLDTRCFAIDTWEGDPQAGAYGAQIFDELQSYHTTRFSAFSTLLRCRFDEALERFEDGSIDLLHIDGYHAYDAVRHDFESWRPKLSDRAVVLFHDTNVHVDGFGVWRLWREVSERFPSFEFLHGHGLGVLAVGPRVPPAVERLCRLSDSAALAMLRQRVALLGEHWMTDLQLHLHARRLAEQEQEHRRTQARLVEEAAERDHLTAQADERHRQLQARLAEQSERVARAERRLADAVQRARRGEADNARAIAACERADAERSHHERARLAAEQARLDAEAALASLQATHAAVLASTTWQAGQVLHSTGSRLPPGVRRAIRGGLRVAWWSLTLRLPGKLRARRDALQLAVPAPGTTAAALAPPASPLAPAGSGPPTSSDLLRARYPALEPLRCYPVPGAGRRLTVVTDSISPGSLFGGVATAIVLAALLAKRIEARLRLVTRSEAAPGDQFAQVLAAHGIAWRDEIEFVHAPPGVGDDVPVTARDVFLTTSWWTTRASRSIGRPERIIHLLQEDERMFYPRGDERLRCAEMLRDPEIRFIVNSELLYRHLAEGPDALPNIARQGIWFEPAFPTEHYYDDPSARAGGVRNFLFYARPNNLRNLYWRGLEAIADAIEDGTLAPEDWRFTFVGRDLSDVLLPRSVRPRLLENLPWPEYAELVRRAHVGMALMDTPHPSYPPLDMAASGVVAITNRFGIKRDLNCYSENIICVEPSVEGLRQGIARAVAIASDETLRSANYARSRLERSWENALGPVLERCVEWIG